MRVFLGFKVINGVRQSFLHVAWKPGKLLLGFSGKLKAIAHVSRRAKVSTLRV
jgi:hypothetical protein